LLQGAAQVGLAGQRGDEQKHSQGEQPEQE
jgi:hypothetical protein